MRGLIKWYFVGVTPTENSYKPEESNRLYEDSLTRQAMEACKDIKIMSMVPLQPRMRTQSYLLTQWKGLPFTLQAGAAVWGYSDEVGLLAPVGEGVCEAIIQERVHGCPG